MTHNSDLFLRGSDSSAAVYERLLAQHTSMPNWNIVSTHAPTKELLHALSIHYPSVIMHFETWQPFLLEIQLTPHLPFVLHAENAPPVWERLGITRILTLYLVTDIDGEEDYDRLSFGNNGYPLRYQHGNWIASVLDADPVHDIHTNALAKKDIHTASVRFTRALRTIYIPLAKRNEGVSFPVQS